MGCPQAVAAPTWGRGRDREPFRAATSRRWSTVVEPFTAQAGESPATPGLPQHVKLSSMDSGPIEEGLTHVDVGCERRLFGLMQALLAARVGRDVDWEAKPPRGVVTEVDATEALLQVAMVIDEALG